MADTSSGSSAFTKGGVVASASQDAYVIGLSNTTTSKHAYTDGWNTAISSQDACIVGAQLWYVRAWAYLAGGGVVSDDTPIFLKGGTYTTDSINAYLESEGDLTTSIPAYISGLLRTSTDAYLEGDPMAYDYIWLKTDDAGATLSKKFRVIAEGYDDGNLSKSQSMSKTIGGGIDASVGAVYKSWYPLIKVRHTETESDYGDLSDLETFYSYNDPGGTPSNRITFIDHHGTSYTVLLVGELRKQYIGAMIEGTDAWVIVPVGLQEVI